MNLRTRISLWTVSLLVATLAAVGAALYGSERLHLQAQAEKTSLAWMEGFAQACRDAVLVQDHLAAINAARALQRSPAVREATCADSVGRPLVPLQSPVEIPSQAKTISVSQGMEKQTWRKLKGETLTRLSLKVTANGKPTAVAAVVFSQTAVDQEIQAVLKDTTRRWGNAFFVVLLLGIGGSVLLARGLTGPILRIAEGTRAVAEGRLDHRIHLHRKDELGRLAEDFDRMALRLAELDRMKEDFVANVTHELRSPLAAIESYSVLIDKDVRGGRIANAGEHLTIVRNNATRLGRFINDLLDVAKIEAKGLDVRPATVRVAELVREVVDLFAAKALEKSIVIELNVPADLTVWADPDKLHQAMTNLTANALKFTPAGGRVSLASVVTPGEIRLTVSDTGPGIAPADQERIFNRFEQARPSQDQVKGPKGTGLGLAIAKGLVEAQGGRMELTSAPGRGSVFSIIFPVRSTL
ncbi:MAG: HAMP domain-containing histidine kinase [Elusimicrobia bacterium]|nr:HAMP domain-containing histidine kinase [Elusimicrobiota bacterium]